jgi:hypothetical protein
VKSRYAEWLAGQGVPLYHGGGVEWQRYHEALVPVEGFPCFVNLEPGEARSLLEESGAWLLRYSSDPTEVDTTWWYIVCDTYDISALKSNRRNKIRRGHRNCSVRKLSPHWLADYGYECYTAAFKRYSGSEPDSREEYREIVLSTTNGPFEYWGVLVDDQLVGYTKCIVEERYVSLPVIKFHPEFLRLYSSYALFDSMLSHYVAERGMAVCNGNRSVAHDTNIQEFLRDQFGFRHLFCKLNIVYRPWLDLTVACIFPFRKLVARVPSLPKVTSVQALMFQEECRRTSLNAAH